MIRNPNIIKVPRLVLGRPGVDPGAVALRARGFRVWGCSMHRKGPVIICPGFTRVSEFTKLRRKAS